MFQSSVFLGALATHKLIGRTDDLKALEAAVNPANPDSFQCLSMVASGGLGKTRLLREVFDRLMPAEAVPHPLAARMQQASALERPQNPSRGAWYRTEPSVVVLELIDLADVALHPLVGFLHEARQRFADVLPDHEEVFGTYDQAWLAYEDARDGELGFDVVAKRTDELRVAFENDYAALTRTLRVVWILDTLEQLYAVPLEIAEYLDAIGLGNEDLGLATYSWLLDVIARAPQRTTLLLAGRPDPGRWVADVQAALPAGYPEPREVAEFSEAETAQYLESLCKQLAQLTDFQLTQLTELEQETEELLKDLKQRAQELREATDDPGEIANLHRLTGGNPIRLALYIDLLFNAETLPAPFHNPSATVGLGNVALQERRDKLENDLLSYLTEHLAEPEPQILEYLSVMRRGLDRARLKMLWGPDDDEAVDDVFNRLQRLSFIKVRGDTLFLHDEFYSIYQRNLARMLPQEQEVERERQQEIFGRLIDYSQKRALELVKAINQIQTEIRELKDSDPNYLANPAYLKKKEHFRALRAERRRYRVERVHYALYNDPRSGLNDMFFRVSGQAFLANEPELDELLQSEVTTFFFGGGQDLNRVQTGVTQEEWQLLRFQVLLERVARWARRLILRIRRQEAQDLIVMASKSHRERVTHYYPDLAPLYDSPEGTLLSRLFQLEWTSVRCIAAIYDGTDPATATEELKGVTARIEEELSRDGLLRTQLKGFRQRLLNILAEGLHYRGFTHANLYEFKVAEELYKQANLILERTAFKILQSDVKNNLARVLGERGNLFEALALCEAAREVREDYGFDLLRGLSRNTLALINTRNARPTRALEHATSALSIFRQINNPRSIALALIQVAEARRRMWNLKAEEISKDPVARRRVDTSLLTEVSKLLDEAEVLFGEKFRSEARLVEIYIERGSLYRDWANFFGMEQAAAEYARAEELYKQAMALAAENDYRYPQHYLSACVNLAWLYARGGHTAHAKDMTDIARAFVPAEYQFNRERPPDANASNVTNFRELSKLDALEAQVLLAREDIEGRLRKHIFAVTGMQLFSPFNPYYLDVNKRQLTSFITGAFKTLAEKRDLKDLTDQIIAQYHLGALRSPLKGLQAEQVIEDAVAQQVDEPSYLID